MSFKIIFLIVAAVGVVVVLPIVMVRSMIAHFRTPPSERPSSGGISAGVGAALQDLDKLVRPSVEHTIEAEHQVTKRDDDQGGE